MAAKKKITPKKDTEGAYAATRKRLLIAQENKKDKAMAARGGSMPTKNLKESKKKLGDMMASYAKYEKTRAKKK